MYSDNNDKQPVAGASSPPTCALHDNSPSCL